MTRKEDVDYIRVYLDEAGKRPLLTREKEKELGRKIREEGDEAARSELIESNLLLVVSNATKFMKGKIPFLDLIGEGNIGLIRATKDYDERRTRFSTYATWWIKHYIRQALDDQPTVVRTPAHVRDAAYKARPHVEKYLDRGEEPNWKKVFGKIKNQPSVQGICKSPERLKEMFEARRRKFVSVSHSSRRPTKGVYDVPDKPQESVFYGVNQIDIANDVREGLEELNGLLTERQRDVIDYRYGLQGKDPMTLREIGEILGISRERVRQIEANAFKLLKWKLSSYAETV